MKILGCLFAAFFPLLVLAESSLPEPQTQCIDLLRECFSKYVSERSNCFFSTAKHPFCEGTELGRLAYRRWASEPKTASGSAPSAFLGPRPVDSECLGRFDTFWEETLDQGPLSEESFSRLGSHLDDCRTSNAIELPRP